MDDIWENDENIQHGNPKDYPEFYNTIMEDLIVVLKMTTFEANKLDSQKYLCNPSLRNYVKDFVFDLFSELSSKLSEPMEACFYG
jgi:hypothetical protein